MSATAARAGRTVRVWVTDAWDTVELVVPEDQTMREVKQRALRQATGRDLPPDEYQVKFRGALILDENRTLSALGIPDRAPLIVLPARRRPVV